jgi:hypothetical protein
LPGTNTLAYFRIDVTFEMRTSEYVEICISIDNQNNRRDRFYVKRKEGEREQGRGETERERACVCVCVCALIKTNDSVDQHPQQRRGDKHICGNNSLSAFVIN